VRLFNLHAVYSGWGRFLTAEMELDSGVVLQRQIEDHGDAAAVLAYDPDRRTGLLVRQPRVGPLFVGQDAYLVEVAAGRIEAGDEAQETILREAMEELGVRLKSVEPVLAAWSMPAVSSERVHLFLGAYALSDRVTAGGGVEEEHEEIEVLELPLKDILRQADAGEILDMKSLILVWALARRRPELSVSIPPLSPRRAGCRRGLWTACGACGCWRRWRRQ
jgi:nudix-type nucleoside diphosphatase (YffH/AdpP family)